MKKSNLFIILPSQQVSYRHVTDSCDVLELGYLSEIPSSAEARESPRAAEWNFHDQTLGEMVCPCVPVTDEIVRTCQPCRSCTHFGARIRMMMNWAENLKAQVRLTLRPREHRPAAAPWSALLPIRYLLLFLFFFEV